MAKVIIIGANGTIGSAVADLLAQDHEVIRVGNRQGDHTVDLSSKTSIQALFEKVGPFDALVCAAGVSQFAGVHDARDEDFDISISNKLMGQVNLIRLASGHISAGGSITITTGMLGRTPGPGTAPTAMVNAGLEGFVRAAALDIGEGFRVNAVSPVFVTETAQRMGMGPAGTMSAAETAKAYQACVQGDMTGQALDARDYGRTV